MGNLPQQQIFDSNYISSIIQMSFEGIGYRKFGILNLDFVETGPVPDIFRIYIDCHC